MRLSARCRRYRQQRGASFGNARQSWQGREGLLLTLETSGGAYGQGEAAPLPGYSDDTLEEAERDLGELRPNALEHLVELGLTAPERLMTALAEPRPMATSSARFAVETAMLDLVARLREEPLHQLLRRVCAPLVAPLAPLPLAALLEPGALPAQAERALAEGFRTLKVKIGAPGAGAAELNELRALRAQLGYGFALRLDANRALPAAEASARLAALAPLAIEFIEEPATDSLALGDAPIPIALDESLRNRAFVEASSRPPQISTWVLKPSVLHGISGCMALVARARALGIDVGLSHLFEGPVGFAAACELALALGAARSAQGLAAHPLLETWGPSPTPRSAWLTPHRRPGLGVQRLEELGT